MEFLLIKKVSSLQHCDSQLLKKNSFEQSDGQKNRKCTVSMFEKITVNGEVIKRSWLCFSQ